MTENINATDSDDNKDYPGYSDFQIEPVLEVLARIVHRKVVSQDKSANFTKSNEDEQKRK